jgi:pilus assembly protein CpaD
MRYEMKLNSRTRHRAATVLRVGVALTLGATLAGCISQREKSVQGWLVAEPTEQHPITVGSTPVGLKLAVPARGYGLTQQQKNKLRYFLRGYRRKDEGPLRVAAPSGGINEVAVMHALGDVRREFRRAGISRRQVQFDAYSGSGGAAAPIKVSYRTFVARGPECGDWSDNLARDPKNIPYRNLGCATQKNLAAMIANPRDLIEPRGMTPRSSQRRDVIMDKYVKGDTTVAKKSDDEKAKVSEIQGGGSN